MQKSDDNNGDPALDKQTTKNETKSRKVMKTNECFNLIGHLNHSENLSAGCE